MKKKSGLFFLFLLISFYLTPCIYYLHGKNNPPDDESAVYTDLKTDEFMDKWMLAGPIPVFEDKPDPLDQAAQKKYFESDILPIEQIMNSVKKGALSIGKNNFNWNYAEAEKGIIDFIKIYGENSFVYAYAYAEVDMVEDKEYLVGLGSDDAVKVWINGESVHEKFIGRPLEIDEDLFLLKLKKGTNKILIKVQNMEYGWNFAVRPIGENLFTEKLVAYSGDGNLDAVKLLIGSNADVNSVNEIGLAPLHAAQINGWTEVEEFLLAKGARTDIPVPSPDKLTDQIFTEVIKEDYPGAAVLAAKDGKIVYSKAFGYADVENKIPVNIDTKFRIGSITKQFTAAAILILQEKGMLSVNDPLSKFIPDFPRGNEVKIHHLLTHTSGIHSYTNDVDFLSTVEEEVTSEEMVEKIKKYDYEFNPGEKWVYNNSGYFLLGYIIEKVSGMSYNDFLQKNLFEPAGMKNTGVHSSKIKLENEALGYSYENNSVKKTLNWEMSRAGGAGSLYSTVEDLFKWNEAVFNGKVLNQESLNAAFTPAVTADGSKTGYGFGWFINEIRGLKNITHGGGLHGFNSDLSRIPDQNFTTVVLTNSLPNIPGLGASPAGARISEIYLWHVMKDQVIYEVNKEISTASFKDYEGQYEYPGGAIMTITIEDNKIFAQLSGQNKFEIFPKAENEFFWKVVDARIKFMRDENGKVIHAVHFQGGQEFKAPVFKQKTEIKLDPAVYDQYTGEYELGKEMKCIISKEGEKLFGQLTGQPKIEIFPESETKFFIKVAAAQVEFFKDESGKVTHFIITQAGNETKAVKVK